jgi:molybdenum cofactor synthesis domain-containing protein
MRLDDFDALDAPLLFQGEELLLRLPELKKGESLFLLPTPTAELPGPQATLARRNFSPGQTSGPLAAGTTLAWKGQALLTVTLRFELPSTQAAHSPPCLRLLAAADIRAGDYAPLPCRKAPALAWVTVSDKGALGERQDESGPAIEETVRSFMPLRCSAGYIVPDEIFRLRALITDLALNQGYDLVISSGGTGLSSRDLTPEALAPLLDRRLHGFEQAMLETSLRITPRAAVSRAVCGSLGRSLVLSLPGSVKSVRENLGAILPALPHALEKLQDRGADCGA